MLEITEAPADAGASDRFWSKVDKTDGCWLWTASVAQSGYGAFNVGRRMCGAHRVAYELAVGAIPAGWHLHHACEVKRCVNPLHLVPIRPAEHILRHPRDANVAQRAKTHCPAGHAYDDVNTYVPADGRRRCRSCRRQRSAEWKARQAGL